MAAETITADAIKEIERLVRDAQPVQFVRPAGYPEHVIMQVGPGDEVTAITIDSEPLARTLNDPTEMVAFANAEATKDDATIFYNESQIVLILDKANSRDTATCKLTLTRQYEALYSMSCPPNQPKPLTQAEFVRLLRIDLRGCLPGDSTLLALVRALKFENGQVVCQAMKHGRESIGKTILQSVTGESELPEEVRLLVPIFTQLPSRSFQVDCAVELLPADGKFRLTPYPGELSKAMDEAMLAVGSILESTDAEIPCYRGQP